MELGYFEYNWQQKCSRRHITGNNSTSALILFPCVCSVNTRRSPMGACLTFMSLCFMWQLRLYLLVSYFVLVFLFVFPPLELMCIVQCRVCFLLPTLTYQVAWKWRIFRIFNLTKTVCIILSSFFVHYWRLVNYMYPLMYILLF